jgi:hypothetical protein
LLSAAGLMIASFFRLPDVNLGVDPANLLTMQTTQSFDKYPVPRIAGALVGSRAKVTVLVANSTASIISSWLLYCSRSLSSFPIIGSKLFISFLAPKPTLFLNVVGVGDRGAVGGRTSLRDD